MARIRAHRRAPAHDVHVLARWRGSMADRGDTDRLAVVSMNDVAGRRTHRPWRSRATDARSPGTGRSACNRLTIVAARTRDRGAGTGGPRPPGPMGASAGDVVHRRHGEAGRDTAAG